MVERLSKNINEDHLREIFGAFGPIRDLDLPMNRTCQLAPNSPPLVRLKLTNNIQSTRIEEPHTSCSTTTLMPRRLSRICMRLKSTEPPSMSPLSSHAGSFRLLRQWLDGVQTLTLVFLILAPEVAVLSVQEGAVED